MKKINLLIIGILLCALVLGTVVPATVAQKQKDDAIQFPHVFSLNGISNEPELQTGDIILIRLNSVVPKFWNLRYWTHSVIYIGDIGDGFNVVESSPLGGVEYSNLDANVGHCDNWAILRVFEDPHDADAAIAFAIDKKNQDRPFDFQSLILPRKQIDGLNSSAGFGYYCTELVWASYFSGCGINLDDNNFSWINPLEIYYSNCIILRWTQYPDLVPKLIH